jgi:hypothetical protein
MEIIKTTEQQIKRASILEMSSRKSASISVPHTTFVLAGLSSFWPAFDSPEPSASHRKAGRRNPAPMPLGPRSKTLAGQSTRQSHPKSTTFN